MERASWHRYFINIAHEVATRATCDRKHVGCVIVRNKNILCTGYNGSIVGTPHCDDVGHMMEDGHCIRTVHAEVNAIAQAAKHGVSVDNAIAYVTLMPCWGCIKTLMNSGVWRIVYDEFYGSHKALLRTLDTNIDLYQLRDNKLVHQFIQSDKVAEYSRDEWIRI
jgi:dCMP deaminase